MLRHSRRGRAEGPSRCSRRKVSRMVVETACEDPGQNSGFLKATLLALD